MISRVCAHFAAVSGFPGADPDGKCDQGCQGPDGPACFDTLEPGELLRARMLKMWIEDHQP